MAKGRYPHHRYDPVEAYQSTAGSDKMQVVVQGVFY